jgi:hypothetical protein
MSKGDSTLAYNPYLTAKLKKKKKKNHDNKKGLTHRTTIFRRNLAKKKKIFIRKANNFSYESIRRSNC